MRDNFRQTKKRGTVRRKQQNKESIGISGMPNQNYIRKRKKVKISLEDLENDDSCSDGEWEEKEFNKRKNKKLSRLDRKSAFNLSETETKARVLPRRAVT